MEREKRQPNHLSFNDLTKMMLKRDDMLTIRFLGGLLDEEISPDAKVVWLDTQTHLDGGKIIISDSFPRVGEKMYAIEVEQAGYDNMAVRVFRYTVEGAMQHDMASEGKGEIFVTFPHPCVVFLSSTRNTPRELKWNLAFHDGQEITLNVPAVLLADMSVEEIARRNLFPIGQFYLRTFGKIGERNYEAFREQAKSLVAALKTAVKCGLVPSYLGAEMQNTIRQTIENKLALSGMEVFDMPDNILETIEWIDFQQELDDAKEEGIEEGIEKGIEKGIVIGEDNGVALSIDRLGELLESGHTFEEASKILLQERAEKASAS